MFVPTNPFLANYNTATAFAPALENRCILIAGASRGHMRGVRGR